MEILSATDEKDLQLFFETLTEEEIQSFCSSKVYYRAVEYYENSHVSKVHFNAGKTQLTAKVRGSENYKVSILLKNNAVYATCTCPNDEMICKHCLAVMMFAVYENVEMDNRKNRRANDDIKKYLYSQSKEELVGLLMKYAPSEFLTEIDNRNLGAEEAHNNFKKAERGIKELFENYDALYDPATFENELTKKIKKLSGLEKSLANELKELIIYVIKEIENVLDQGYLYDQYSDYSFGPSEEFYAFITNCISVLDFKQKTEFINKLEVIIGESSYSTFSDFSTIIKKAFTRDDLPRLKTMLLRDYQSLPYTLLENYYQCVSESMSIEERKKILVVLKEGECSWAIKLAELLNIEGKQKESIAILEQWLSKDTQNYANEEIYFLYLDLLKQENIDLQQAAKDFITRCPSESMLKKIATLLPSEAHLFEQLLERGNPQKLLDYLENSGRLKDALGLVKRNKHIWVDRVFSFYKRNKEEFPQDAEKFFCRMIDENLQNMGDHHYYAIVDSLQHLKKINSEATEKLVHNIRLNYKRRSKLMSIISKV
jgi:hypothetical protein